MRFEQSIPTLIALLAFTVCLGGEDRPAGNTSDDFDIPSSTLRYYVSKSHSVVSATIIVEPTTFVSDREGIGEASAKVLISEVLYGAAPPEKELTVTIIRDLTSARDQITSLLKKDTKVILFLRKSANRKPEWYTANMWFGVQPYSTLMDLGIKTLAKEK